MDLLAPGITEHGPVALTVTEHLVSQSMGPLAPGITKAPSITEHGPLAPGITEHLVSQSMDLLHPVSQSMDLLHPVSQST